MRGTTVGGVILGAVVLLTVAREARAGERYATPPGRSSDDASVSIGRDDDAVIADPPPRAVAPIAASPELYRSPFRVHVGPAGVTSGQNLGLGLGVAMDFGSGSVGARFAASWVRGGKSGSADDTSISAPGSTLAQYTGELTLDLHKSGPLHPVFGIGFGVANIGRPGASGTAGIGTARFAVEYALGLDDADVRLGAGVTGVLPGPADREVQDVRAYALLGATISVGF